MRITLGIALIFTALITSCNKPPEACITVDSSNTTVGSEVELSAECSKKALSYLWTFEGPSGSALNETRRSEEIFTISFDTSGTYRVILDAYSKYSWVGQKGSAETTITVN